MAFRKEYLRLRALFSRFFFHLAPFYGAEDEMPPGAVPDGRAPFYGNIIDYCILGDQH